jgi:hypothetical protein
MGTAGNGAVRETLGEVFGASVALNRANRTNRTNLTPTPEPTKAIAGAAYFSQIFSEFCKAAVFVTDRSEFSRISRGVLPK